MLPSLSRLIYPPLISNRTNSDPTMSSFNSSASLGYVDDDHTFLCPAEIHLIIGPMFAGKTTALLRRIISAENNGRNVVMVKSSKDNRYAIDSVVTHDGVDFPCLALKNLSSFKKKYGAEAYDKLDVIGIDEAQFFEDLYDFCTQVVDYDGKTVIVAGLDGDYLRRRFGPILDLVPVADTVTKLSARCELCDNCALFTFRKTEETETELVGGKDTYIPLCRQHYVIGQAAMENAMEASVSGVCQSQTLIDETQLKAELLI